MIKTLKKIVSPLKENVQNTKMLSDLCEGLLLWEKISPFLVTTKIEDVAICEKQLEDCIVNVKNSTRLEFKVFSQKTKEIQEEMKLSACMF